MTRRGGINCHHTLMLVVLLWHELGQTRFNWSLNGFALAMQLDGRVDQWNQENNTVTKSALFVMWTERNQFNSQEDTKNKKCKTAARVYHSVADRDGEHDQP